MKKIAMMVVVYAILIFAYGCSSVNVGGTGKIGTVTGGGSVSIPAPR